MPGCADSLALAAPMSTATGAPPNFWALSTVDSVSGLYSPASRISTMPNGRSASEAANVTTSRLHS